MVVGSQSSFMPMRRRFSKTAAMRERSSASFPSFSTSDARVTVRCAPAVVWRLRQASRNLPVMRRQSPTVEAPMRRFLLAVLAVAFAASLATPLKAQGAPPQGAAGQPYAVEYYYKCQWGHQEEFLQLFLKNHFPLLQKVQSTGRILSLKIETPAYHTTEDGRWDYRVTIVFKNSTLAT